MKNVIFILFITLLAACSKPEWPSEDYINEYNYQEVTKTESDSTYSNKSYRLPMYPNGIKGVADVISKNFNYPQDAINKGIAGNVVVTFTVGTDGYAKDFKITKSLFPSIDKEAIRVMKLLKRWIPGQIDGQFVDVAYSQPIGIN